MMSFSKHDDPISEWEYDRRKNIRQLHNLADEIDNHAKNAKIASAVGGGTSVAAGIGAAICYFVAPITLGASLVPGIALTGVAIAGGATSIGSSIINHFIEKGYMKDVQEALDNDRRSFKKLQEAVEAAKEVTAGDGMKYAYKLGKSISGGLSLVSTIATQLTVSQKAAASLLKLGQTARFVGHTVAFVALPFDILFFIKDVIDLTDGNISEAAQKVRKLANDLDYEMRQILADA